MSSLVSNMSVFVHRSLVEFRAPLSISESKISVSGSWSSYTSPPIPSIHIHPSYLFHMRLHTWRQTIDKDSANACLDWCIDKNDQTLTHYVVMRFDSTQPSFRESVDNVELHTFIDNVLNMSSVVKRVSDAIDAACQLTSATR